MCSWDWETGNQSPSQPAEAKKDQCSPPCVADVFHKPSSQLGRSCPNRRPWEKMMRRREGRGRRKEAQGGSGEGGGLGKALGIEEESSLRERGFKLFHGGKVPRRYARVIALPQSRDGRLWASAKASAASTKLCSVFRSQGPSELQSGLSAPCLCPQGLNHINSPQSDHASHNPLPDEAGGPKAC
ncbi:hypothetical protein EYF80_005701 [Liparis tanakae]|uniref:Uncharacterized protein n=1 Tax=Liparis tanakae TaxID=230148 RepID=A0A4Z2J1B3_9TELE|nr:hypothetical protein EYF80_005701 [Liparis tanakae]